MLVVACACGPLGDAKDSASTSGTGGASMSASTAMLDGMSAPTSSSTDASLTGTDDESDDEPGGDPADDDIKFDLHTVPDAMPEIQRCESSNAQQIDLAIVGPDGAVATAYGWWGWEQCCVNDPWIVLSDSPQLDVTQGQITTPHFAIFTIGAWDQSGPYLGPMPVWFDLQRDVQHDTGFELLEPLDPDLSTEDGQPLLSSTFAIDNAGWSAQGTAIVPHCDALDTLPCPCE